MIASTAPLLAVSAAHVGSGTAWQEVEDRAAVTEPADGLVVDDESAAQVGPQKRVARVEVVVGDRTENRVPGGVHDDVDTGAARRSLRTGARHRVRRRRR